MTGLTSRRKGRRAETEAAHVLAERGFTIIELGPGRKTEDIVAELDGARYSCEVKNCALWKITDWRRQAKEQARRRKARWMLLCRVPGMRSTFYVERGDGRGPCVWRGNGAERKGT
jgi:Holliday junction resolvase